MTTALVTVLALGGAGAACWAVATSAADFIETRSRQDVRLALTTGGHDWAQVETDGLRVRLTGTAPSEVQRFRAMTDVSAVVDASRIIDDVAVASTETLTPPDFGVELLRNDQGISLIGLVPAGLDRETLVRNLRNGTGAPQVADLLEGADYPVPDGWQAALDYGLRVAQMAPRSKISISAGHVAVTALTDSADDKARLETALNRVRPALVTLTTDISAPRPVIAPFVLRFVLDEDGARFDACSADSDAARDRILAAAVRAGAGQGTGCTIGLGAPSPEWDRAAVAGIGAVAAVGGGTVTLSDTDVALLVPASVSAAQYDDTVGRLESALPRGFSLSAEHERPETANLGPAEFSASVGHDGTVTLRGRITDDRMRDAVDSFAGARFAQVDSSLRADPDVPGGWTVRVIAGLEAMAPLKTGSVTVTPDMIRISGVSGDQQASDRAAAVLADRLGAGAHYEMSVRYDRRLDASLGLPDGPECVAQMNTIMAESAIGFEPNKSVIAGDPAPTLASLAGVMENCADFRIEIGGHTDSQGSDAWNAELSRNRAQAVLAALDGAGVDTGSMTARGYGESQPIATNETDEGREANRRIEFRLLSELPVTQGTLPAPQVTSGVTGETPAPAPAPVAAAAATAVGLIGPLLPDVLVPEDAASGPLLPAPLAAMPAAPGAPGADAAETGPPTIPPSVVGVSESVGPVPDGLDLGEESVTVPVQTPDDDTPRPQPRPDGSG
ncbi:MAG: OmpA family protein [Paracoccus sp. (in: a-proteobacteria)]|uniref:OmpA family protein n=1 Tax=Paracoccus sp. TaxID=267 RepID=UPI0026DFB23D|nr:OmpA family protein [Paracoccus sp. (in: a-proteobacteria)]MDO5612800.1 OmpA family protein [Paracoccus sp. (in: a-proteobacteria)]